jgi:4'-phosphopantetheinyl transferase
MGRDEKDQQIDEYAISLWPAPPADLKLNSDEVHVWAANLEAEKERNCHFSGMLSPDELEKARRYYFEKDRNHFIAARGILRSILGGYLNIEPAGLCFTYSTYGKPSISGEQNPGRVFFNISHSYGLALYAFSYCGEIGIDIERIRPEQYDDSIASEILSKQEIALLNALPSDQRAKSFFACWVRKEAFLKACGRGLSIAPEKIEVSLTAGGPYALPGMEGDCAGTLWSFRDLDACPGYAAALAVRQQDCQVKYLKWG